ncbi:piggyBac transposable element-derived protein 1-like [Anthonomus grandis grandis]|uniref:piggyBac transposable element-derived protein 1-like n=1 Tax=Anthonomus grandis grandis TaxID=2921223 RepID=UPI002165E60F|nr:piggyBac transposable element-derived protein 1-like [Anthonomus grandis grandis]
MASTSLGSAPVTEVRRWDKKNNKYLLVSCPNSVTSYNHSMGKVDMCDRLISYYRICMRTKKWPVRVFWHFVDLAITNSWVEYRQDCFARGDRKNSIMDLLEFKLYIGKSLALGAQAKGFQDPTSSLDEETSQPAKKMQEVGDATKRCQDHW